MTWQADSLHAVVFFNPAGAPDALQPWLRMFKNPPSAYNSNPPGAPPGATSSGVIGAYQVLISAQMGRVEVALSPPGAPSSDAPDQITDTEEALSVLREYAVQLLQGMSPVRLAIVANLARRVESAAEAAAAVRRDVPPLDDIPLDASDVQFAVNMKKDIANLGRAQNRLCRWSTGVQQVYTMQMTVGSAEPSLALREFHAEVWSIDVNTAGNGIGSDLTDDVVVALCTEVAGLIGGGYQYLVA